MDGRGRLAQDARQIRRIDERQPAEGVEYLSVGESYRTSVAKEGYGAQPSHGGVGIGEDIQSSRGDTPQCRKPSITGDKLISRRGAR